MRGVEPLLLEALMSAASAMIFKAVSSWPAAAAMMRQVSPSLLRPWMAEGGDTSARAESAGVWPLEAASMRGVEPALLVAITSAPEDRSNCRQAVLPAAADACSGVFPSSSLWLRSGWGTAESRAERVAASHGIADACVMRLEDAGA